jgi:cobalt-zinc-cadmium efflux system protein
MTGRMALAVAVTALVLVVEVAGGFMSGSLALLSDAGHVFSDLLALTLSWYGVRQVRQPANARMTYGYHRVGIFVALVNAATLVGVSLAVMAEAYRRLLDPEPVRGDAMLVIALAGLLANLFVLVVLRGHSHNMAVRSAVLHVAGDLLGSVAVVASGGIIIFTGWMWADPMASVVISLIITVGSLRIVREALNVLLESTPRGIDMSEVLKAMYGVAGVRDVHDLHIWSISPELRALSSHITVDDTQISQAGPVLWELNHMLDERFGIRHSTIQLEVAGFDPNELYCNLTEEPGGHTGEHAHVRSS